MGVGYSPDYVDKSTNPIIARMRNQFTSTDLPELKSELTATGRRAGSSGFGQIQKAYENQGLNEEAAYAPVYQQAEEAARQDKNSGVQELGAFNTGDYNARSTAANFDNSLYGQQSSNIQADNAANNQKGANIVQGAVALAGIPFTGGASAAGFSPSVNYGGVSYPISQPPIGQQDYYKQMLARNVSGTGQVGRVV